MNNKDYIICPFCLNKKVKNNSYNLYLHSIRKRHIDNFNYYKKNNLLYLINK
jgi:hypothetical protein